MAQRAVALCDGKYIGIETIFTVIDGRQINIPEKLEELRSKSQANQLFCPCGCGANLILVAGDRNLKEQHFRIKDKEKEKDCHAVVEGETSIKSKIALKMWLDDKLRVNEVESRVPICDIADSQRRYEFTFLVKTKGIAINYCYDRKNLTDEKIQILENNGSGIYIIHIVDHQNGDIDGQFPEWMMKIQRIQGFCLVLDIANGDYNRIKLQTIVYKESIDGLWERILVRDGFLKEYSFSEDGILLYNQWPVNKWVAEEVQKYQQEQENEKERRTKKAKEKIERKKEEKRLRDQRWDKEIERRELRKRQDAIERYDSNFYKSRYQQNDRDNETLYELESVQELLSQQEIEAFDENGQRWVKCAFCGKSSIAEDFVEYGGEGRSNLGTCKECARNCPELWKKKEEEIQRKKEIARMKVMKESKYRNNKCPKCGGILRERNGKYGKFYGCSNYPRCNFTQNRI